MSVQFSPRQENLGKTCCQFSFLRVGAEDCQPGTGTQGGKCDSALETSFGRSQAKARPQGGRPWSRIHPAASVTRSTCSSSLANSPSATSSIGPLSSTRWPPRRSPSALDPIIDHPTPESIRCVRQKCAKPTPFPTILSTGDVEPSCARLSRNAPQQPDRTTMIRPGATVPTDHRTRGPIDSSGRSTLENEATPTRERSRSRVGTKPISSRGEADRASERSQFRTTLGPFMPKRTRFRCGSRPFAYRNDAKFAAVRSRSHAGTKPISHAISNEQS